MTPFAAPLLLRAAPYLAIGLLGIALAFTWQSRSAAIDREQAALQRVTSLGRQVIKANDAVETAQAANTRLTQERQAIGQALAAAKAALEAQEVRARVADEKLRQAAQDARRQDVARRARTGLPSPAEMTEALRTAVDEPS